jgi:hypothetical protein
MLASGTFNVNSQGSGSKTNSFQTCWAIYSHNSGKLDSCWTESFYDPYDLHWKVCEPSVDSDYEYFSLGGANPTCGDPCPKLKHQCR